MDYEKAMLGRFLQEYGNMFSEKVKEYIVRHFFDDKEDRINIISQIRGLYGMDCFYEDRYQLLFNELKNDFDLNCNVLEVGSGFFSIMAHYVDNYQQKGSITAIDPNIIDKNVGNIIIKKEKFDALKYNGNYDFIFGISPCSATNEIILSANIHKKPFMIALCGCVNYGDSKDIIEYVNETKCDDAIVEVKYVDYLSYPIIEKKFLK